MFQKIVALLCVAVVVGLSNSACGQESELKPVHLRCEFLKDPLGVDIARPRLSWRLESAARAQEQSAFQIVVASSADRLDANQGDLWDTGKKSGSHLQTAVYDGKPLPSASRAYWKIRVWDKQDRASAWSEPALWSIGLLKPEDWTAQWIGSTSGASAEPAPFFRKKFNLEKQPRQATLFISGLGYYELHLNGAKVGDHELDPAFTRYDRRALYVTYDVTHQLTRGDNAVGVILGNGWYNYHITNAWDFEKAPWRHQPRVIAQLRVEFEDGSIRLISTDDTWKQSTGPIVYDGFLSGEVYDARLEKAGWDTAAYDDSAWASAKTVSPPGPKLSTQMVPPIRVVQTIKPVKVTQPKPGVFLFDIGQNIAGVARLHVSGPAGTEVKLQFAELLHPDGTLDADNIKTFCKSGEFQTDKYILKGQGTETWQPRFMYHGFQYIQVTGFPGEPKLENIEALVMHTDLEEAGSFESSSELLNKIQHATRWSYLNNFHGHPTDCPNRERNGWTGDAHLAVETGFYNFDPAAAYSGWMRDFQDEQRPSGELPGIVPTGGWGYAWGNGPAWDSSYILIPWAQFSFTGDTEILAAHYENMKRYVDYLTSKSSNSIVAIGLGDWCPAKTTTPEKVTSTGYYYRDSVLLSRIAAILGKTDDAAKYSTLAEGIKKAFNREFYDAKTGLYAGGTQTALSCALYQGLVDPANIDAVVSNLASNVAAQQGRLDCGILGTKYLLHALTDNGRVGVAYTVASQTEFPSWGKWIKQGATTLWEGWDGSGTHNHIMFGDISAWFYQTLAGIQIDAGAADDLVISPRLVSGLTWVNAHYDTIHGRVESRWKRDGDKLRLEVTIPPNSHALVCVPAKDLASITESGVEIAKADGVTAAGARDGAQILKVQSGHYIFEVK